MTIVGSAILNESDVVSSRVDDQCWSCVDGPDNESAVLIKDEHIFYASVVQLLVLNGTVCELDDVVCSIDHKPIDTLRFFCIAWRYIAPPDGDLHEESENLVGRIVEHCADMLKRLPH